MKRMPMRARHLRNLLVLLFTFPVWLTAHAHNPRDDEMFVFDIPPSSLMKAVQTLSRQTGVEIGVTAKDNSVTTTPLQGTYAFSEALHRLLSPIGLSYYWLNSRQGALGHTLHFREGAWRMTDRLLLL